MVEAGQLGWFNILSSLWNQTRATQKWFLENCRTENILLITQKSLSSLHDEGSKLFTEILIWFNHSRVEDISSLFRVIYPKENTSKKHENSIGIDWSEIGKQVDGGF